MITCEPKEIRKLCSAEVNVRPKLANVQILAFALQMLTTQGVRGWDEP
jgi:hypothetical protein